MPKPALVRIWCPRCQGETAARVMFGPAAEDVGKRGRIRARRRQRRWNVCVVCSTHYEAPALRDRTTRALEKLGQRTLFAVWLLLGGCMLDSQPTGELADVRDSARAGDGAGRFVLDAGDLEDAGGLETDAAAELDAGGGLETDAAAELDAGGLEADAAAELDAGGLETDAAADACTCPLFCCAAGCSSFPCPE